MEGLLVWELVNNVGQHSRLEKKAAYLTKCDLCRQEILIASLDGIV